ncbi:MAG: OmpA family protein [Treponema sp.]|jgi:outer membrane protein OmpA-like peptidoglycan-associated protein|nr:OmpA family protein [Treponema sp.]
MERIIFKRLLIQAMIFSVSLTAHAQEAPGPAFRFKAGGAVPYSVTERSDWSRYDNGKYTGHVCREVRASIVPAETGGAPLYRGNFFVFEETLRDLRQSARALDEIIPAAFRVDGDGTTRIEDDKGFPSLRGFPAFPAKALKPGDKWTAPGSRAVDPLNNGSFTVVPFTAGYEYKGAELYKGEPVYRISSAYAPRCQGEFRLQGNHAVDILIRREDGTLLMMRDNLDETYTWPDGSTLRFRGFTLTFGQGLIPMNQHEVIASLEETITEDDIQGGNIEIATVPEGVRLTVREIRFIPDTAAFLPEEQPRLDTIAQALKKVPDRTILVEGHTAAVGLPEGEMELSVERARKMIEELVRRGIPAGRFMYKGWGGSKPLGDNSSEEGRRLNRRVEITILE